MRKVISRQEAAALVQDGMTLGMLGFVTLSVPEELLVSLAALALLVWLAFFIISGSLTVPLLRTGFRMVVFSVIIMIVVLFFRRGIMGDKEFSDILFARRKASGKGAVK